MEFKAKVKIQPYSFKGMRVLAPNANSSQTSSLSALAPPTTPPKTSNTSLQFQRPSQRYTTQPPAQTSQPRPTTSNTVNDDRQRSTSFSLFGSQNLAATTSAQAQNFNSVQELPPSQAKAEESQKQPTEFDQPPVIKKMGSWNEQESSWSRSGSVSLSAEKQSLRVGKPMQRVLNNVNVTAENMVKSLDNDKLLKLQQMEKNNKQLTEKLQQAQQQIAKSYSEKQMMIALKGRVEGQKQTLLMEKQQLLKQMQTVKQEKDQIVTQNQKLKEQLTQSDQQLRHNRALNENLMKRQMDQLQKIKDFEATMAQSELKWQAKSQEQLSKMMEEERSRHQADKQLIEKGLFQAKAALVDAEKQHGMKVREMEEAIMRIDQEAMRLDKENIRMIEELKQTLKQLEKSLDEKNRLIKEAFQHKENHKKVMTELSTEKSSRKVTEQQVKTLNNKLQKTQQQLKEAQQLLKGANISENMEKHEQAERRIDTLKRQMEAAKEKQQQLIHRMAQVRQEMLKQFDEKMGTMKEEALEESAGLYQKLVLKENQINNLSQKCSSLKQQLEEQQNTHEVSNQVELTKTLLQLQQAQQENQDLKSDAAEAEAEIKQLTDECSQLQSTKEKLQLCLKEAQKTISESFKDFNESARRIEDLEEECESLRQGNSDGQALIDAQVRIEELERELEVNEQSWKLKAEEWAAREKEIDQRKQQLDETQRDYREFIEEELHKMSYLNEEDRSIEDLNLGQLYGSLSSTPKKPNRPPPRSPRSIEHLHTKIEQLTFYNEALRQKVEELTDIDENSNKLILAKIKVFEENLERSEQEKSEMEEKNLMLSIEVSQLTEKCRYLEEKAGWAEENYKRLEEDLAETQEEVMRAQASYYNIKYQLEPEEAESEVKIEPMTQIEHHSLAESRQSQISQDIIEESILRVISELEANAKDSIMKKSRQSSPVKSSVSYSEDQIQSESQGSPDIEKEQRLQSSPGSSKRSQSSSLQASPPTEPRLASQLEQQQEEIEEHNEEEEQIEQDVKKMEEDCFDQEGWIDEDNFNYQIRVSAVDSEGSEEDETDFEQRELEEVIQRSLQSYEEETGVKEEKMGGESI